MSLFTSYQLSSTVVEGWWGTGHLAVIESAMNSAANQSIWESCLRPFVRQVKLDPNWVNRKGIPSTSANLQQSGWERAEWLCCNVSEKTNKASYWIRSLLSFSHTASGFWLNLVRYIMTHCNALCFVVYLRWYRPKFKSCVSVKPYI